MSKIVELLKTWQAYPGVIVAALLPWIEPFRRVPLVNKLWRPEIDLVVEAILALYVLWLAMEELQKKPKTWLKRSFARSAATGVIAGILCHLVYRIGIHKMDPDYLAIANIGWAALYVLVFLAIVRMVFAALLALR